MYDYVCHIERLLVTQGAALAEAIFSLQLMKFVD